MSLVPPAIRRATVADAPALSAFAASVFPLGCPNTDPADLAAYIESELTPECILRQIEDSGLIVLMAESLRQPVGYMVVARENPHPALAVAAPSEFRKLYVAPAYHGSGLAHALVHCALSMLQSEGPRAIWLSAFTGNPRAIAFYQKWGFRVAGEQIFLVGKDAQKDYLMLREASATLAPL